MVGRSDLNLFVSSLFDLTIDNAVAAPVCALWRVLVVKPFLAQLFIQTRLQPSIAACGISPLKLTRAYFYFYFYCISPEQLKSRLRARTHVDLEATNDRSILIIN